MKELEILESKRKKCPYFVYGGIAGAILSFLLLIATSNMAVIPIFCMLLLMTSIIFIVIGNVQFKKVEKDFKNIYMQKIVSEILPGSTYKENMGVPLNDVYRSGLLKKADRSKTEDLITGNIKGVNFKTSDLQLLERREHVDSKGHRTVTYVPYFTGRFFMFDFNKNFKGNLVITEASFSKPFGMKKVSMESEEFNKKFKTYAHDDLSAFYVLTPHLMVSLLELEQQNPGCIMISMNSNIMYMAINNNRDTFSIKMNQKIDQKLLDLFEKDLNVINNIIEEMKLNNKIFKEDY